MFFRIEEARALGANYVRNRGFAKTADSFLVEKAEFSAFTTYDVFLSHSYADAQVILGIAVYLEGQGKKVYVDWIVDKGLDRSKVTADTANILRARMQASKSLIYATSENATKSKWMPWELGYFDGHKPGMVSILPLVSSDDSEWKGQEYLGLYPLVDRLQVAGGTLPFVVRKDTSAQMFSDFGKTNDFVWKSQNGKAVIR